MLYCILHHELQDKQCKSNSIAKEANYNPQFELIMMLSVLQNIFLVHFLCHTIYFLMPFTSGSASDMTQEV